MNADRVNAIQEHLDRLNGLLLQAEPIVNEHVVNTKPATGKQLRALYQKIEAEVRRGKQLF